MNSSNSLHYFSEKRQQIYWLKNKPKGRGKSRISWKNYFRVTLKKILSSFKGIRKFLNFISEVTMELQVRKNRTTNSL